MSAVRGALGARQPAGGPDATVERARPSIHGGVGRAIKLLRSTDQIKAFFGELIAAMNGLEPAEPDNELYKKRIDSANDIWDRVNKADHVTDSDVERLFERICSASLSTQQASEETPPAAPAAFSPQSFVGSIYARRRSTGK